MAAARWHFDAGDLPRAEALIQRVLDGSPPDSPRAHALQLGAQLGARRSNFSAAAERAEAALALAGEDDRLQAGIELELVYCGVSLGDLAGAESHGAAAVAHAEAAGDNAMLADGLAVLTLAEFLCGRGLDEARLRRALELEDPLAPRSFMMRPTVILGMLQLWSGELDGALRTLTAIRLETVERGQEGVAPMMSLYLSWAHVWSGQVEEAGRLSAEARDAAELLEDPTAQGMTLTAAAPAHAHDGHTEIARIEAQQALALFERLQWRSGVVWPLWVLGLVELVEENPTSRRSKPLPKVSIDRGRLLPPRDVAPCCLAPAGSARRRSQPLIWRWPPTTERACQSSGPAPCCGLGRSTSV